MRDPCKSQPHTKVQNDRIRLLEKMKPKKEKEKKKTSPVQERGQVVLPAITDPYFFSESAHLFPYFP
jgi:hypothetical protein